MTKKRLLLGILSNAITTLWLFSCGGEVTSNNVDTTQDPFAAWQNHTAALKTTTTTYVYAGNMRIAREEDTGHRAYMHQDHLSSVSLEADHAGVKQTLVHYSPYGEPLTATNARYLYNGKERENGVYDYHFRHYDAGNLNRFIKADDIQPDLVNPQSLDPYAYVENNPIRYTDPTGHCIFAGVDTLACYAIGLGVVATGVTIAHDFATGGPLSTSIKTVGSAIAEASKEVVLGVGSILSGNTSDAGTAAERFFSQTREQTIRNSSNTTNDITNGQTLEHPNKQGEVNTSGVQERKLHNGDRLSPDPKAKGSPHSSIRVDAKTGEVTNYATYKPDKNGIPVQTKRVDIKGQPHRGVPTPHVHEPAKPPGIRPARPDEIPKKQQP